MKKSVKFFKSFSRGYCVTAIVLAIMLLITGCKGFLSFGNTTVTIRSNLQSVRLGGTLQFTASGRDINWIVSSTTDGSGPVSSGTFINSSGLLTVSITEIYLTIYVIAISRDNDTFDVKEVRIASVENVIVNPNGQQIIAGRTQQFSAAVTGTNRPDPDVTWRVSSNSAGTGAVTQGTGINNSGMLTVAPRETITTLYVIAASVVDPSVSGIAVVNVLIPTVTGVTVSPATQTVTAGGTLQLNATVTGINSPSTDVTWTVARNISSGTAVNRNGQLTVAANETSTTLIITATSAFDPSRSGNAVITVLVPTVTSVIVNPQTIQTMAGSTLQFSAAVAGTNNPSQNVTWNVTGAQSSTQINNNGQLTIAANETATTLFVTATSAIDPSRSGNAVVSVTPAPSQPPVTVPTPTPTVTNVTVNPQNQQTTRGSAVQFSATVTGTNNPNTAVTWRVSSNAAGTGAVTSGTAISPGGLLTVSANETVTTLYVTATSAADQSRSGNAVVTVNIPAPVPTVTSVTVSPSGQSIERGRTAQFTATVAGTNNPNNAVTWRVSSNAAGTGSVTSGTSISPYGVLTISGNETNTTLYVIAASTADTTKSGSVTVTVITPAPTIIGVTVSPSNQSVDRGRTLQLNATVTGTGAGGSTGNAVTWRVSSNAAGTGAVTSGTSINNNGLLTISANETVTTLYVFATSTVDPTKSGSATVTVRRSGNQNDQGEDNNQQ